MTSPFDLLMARCVEVAPPVPRITGHIYFLVDGTEVVYIGQTTSIEQRIACHWEQSRTPSITDWRTGEQVPNHDCKLFTRAFAMECELADLTAVESALIRLIRPRYNRRAGAHEGRDNEILASLGLPVHADEKANAREFKRLAYRPRGPRTDWDREIIAAGRARRRKRPDQVRRRLRRLLWRAVKPLIVGVAA